MATMMLRDGREERGREHSGTHVKAAANCVRCAEFTRSIHVPPLSTQSTCHHFPLNPRATTFHPIHAPPLDKAQGWARFVSYH
eukprot:363516-Chlamydomonas_euryale.AAC.3